MKRQIATLVFSYCDYKTNVSNYCSTHKKKCTLTSSVQDICSEHSCTWHVTFIFAVTHSCEQSTEHAISDSGLSQKYSQASLSTTKWVELSTHSTDLWATPTNDSLLQWLIVSVKQGDHWPIRHLVKIIDF